MQRKRPTIICQRKKDELSKSEASERRGKKTRDDTSLSKIVVKVQVVYSVPSEVLEICESRIESVN